MARQGAMGVEELIWQKVASLRRWKKTKLCRSRSKWDFRFSIMTYNILSGEAVDNHMYLYRNCNPHFLQEDYRISRIMPEILKSKSDIICLQEVEQHLFFNMIEKVFDSNGFASIFKKRTGHKTDGCAILWRKKKFDLVRQKAVEFRTNSCQLLDRDNIGLIAVLKPIHQKFTNMQLHIATTHLLFNPRRGDIKLCQLRWLLAELERMSLKEVQNETRHYHPVILCGDFNIEPHSPLYQFIENGRIDIMNVMSGDLSGQAEGKNKGRLVDGDNMLLCNIGINEASRFEEVSTQEENSPNSASSSSVSGGKKRDRNFKSFQTQVVSPDLKSGIRFSNDATLSPKQHHDESLTHARRKPKSGNNIEIPAPTRNTQENHSKFVSTSGESKSGFTLSDTKLFDPNLLAAIGSSNDPRWISTLLAMGHKELASEFSARLKKEQKSSNNNSQTDLDPNLAGSSKSEAEKPETEELCFYHDFKFVPAYKYHAVNPKSLPITSMTGNDCNTVDHIFYGVKNKRSVSSYSEGPLKLLAYYSLMHAEGVKELGGLPNAGLGSDHISLIAEFAICTRR
ncbi:protein angel homolog 2 [Caerostris extrusa]|uniref:Protein angel homolog 2 n=1 Tax=Caerostris extrusa TaxID=172846 RepID=A0AAV4SLQ8_CAEEX|nr:protein angel homolog 2 [Caerostris extrusa]